MKKGESTEFKEAQKNMQRIFAKIQENPALQRAYLDIKDGSSVPSNQNVSTQLVNLSIMLDTYMNEIKDTIL